MTFLLGLIIVEQDSAVRLKATARKESAKTNSITPSVSGLFGVSSLSSYWQQQEHYLAISSVDIRELDSDSVFDFDTIIDITLAGWNLQLWRTKRL
jgi:hypothetical protein